MSGAGVVFGQWMVSPREFFFASRRSLALVNSKPLVPGHVLVVPKRRTSRFADLSAAEVADLWTSAQRVGAVLERHYNATACTYAMQDGRHAGQTVDHVHVHVLPRAAGDFERNDQVYEQLDANDWSRPVRVRPIAIEEETRVARSIDEMAAEADTLRALFEPSEQFDESRAHSDSAEA